MRRIAAILLIIVPCLASGQVVPLLEELITTSPTKPSLEKEKYLNHFIQTIQQKEIRSEKGFLKSIFKTTHQKYLKTYSPYVDLSETLTAGRYDCLTATALFSVLLTETNFDYQIIETNYHIFILVNTREGQVLLETTDRFSGFVDNPREINKRIASYRHNEIVNVNDNRTPYQYTFDLFHEVRPSQLAGLLYFNQAVKAYNRHDFLGCAALLDQSKNIYESPRVEELVVVLVKSVLESDLSATIKGSIIQQYKSYLYSKNSPMTSSSR